MKLRPKFQPHLSIQSKQIRRLADFFLEIYNASCQHTTLHGVPILRIIGHFKYRPPTCILFGVVMSRKCFHSPRFNPWDYPRFSRGLRLRIVRPDGCAARTNGYNNSRLCAISATGYSYELRADVSMRPSSYCFCSFHFGA
mgnify:CR=1 FL=1